MEKKTPRGGALRPTKQTTNECSYDEDLINALNEEAGLLMIKKSNNKHALSGVDSV